MEHTHNILEAMRPDRSDGWTYEEYEVYKACRDRVEAPEATAPTDANPGALLNVVRAVFMRHHRVGVSPLKRARHLTRALTLLTRSELYPPAEHEGALLLEARLELAITILEMAHQQSVAQEAAWICLALEDEHHWIEHEAFSKQRRMLTDAIHSDIAPILELRILLGRLGRQDDIARYDDYLRGASLEEKQMWLDGFVRVLASYPDDGPHRLKELAQLTDATFETVFAETTSDTKIALLERLLDALRRDTKPLTEQRCQLVLDPIVSQNARNLTVLEGTMRWLVTTPASLAAPYVVHYLTVATELFPQSVLPEVLDFAERAGTRAMVPSLYVLTDLGGSWLDRPLDLEAHAQRAIDAICEREDLDRAAGALSVAQGEGGELTLTKANQGALTVHHDPVSAQLPATTAGPTSSPFPSPRVLAIGGTILIGLTLLIGLAWCG